MFIERCVSKRVGRKGKAIMRLWLCEEVDPVVAKRHRMDFAQMREIKLALRKLPPVRGRRAAKSEVMHATVAGLERSLRALRSHSRRERDDYGRAVGTGVVRCARMSYEAPGISVSTRWIDTTAVDGRIVRRTLFNELRYVVHDRRSELRQLHSDSRDRIGGVRTRPGWFLQEMKDRRTRVLREEKRPRQGKKYVGVEIECFYRGGHAEFLEVLAAAGLGPWVNVGSDGSIEYDSDEGDRSAELRVLVTEEEYKTVIPRVCKALAMVSAGVNRSCGLHVHLDMRAGRIAEDTYAKLVHALPLLNALVAPSRLRNSYCMQNRTTDWQDSLETGRYQAVNPQAYNEHRTIEVRLHHGTVDAEKICNWIELLISIADGPDLGSGLPKTLGTIQRKLGFSPECAAYMVERIRHFHSEAKREGSPPFVGTMRGRPRSNTIERLEAAMA